MSWQRLLSVLVTAVLVLASSLSIPRTTHAAAVVVVSPADMHGWFFVLETGSSGTGQMVIGPGTPPLGLGSARLTAPNSSDGMVLAKLGWNGVRLDHITKLQYSTFRTSGGPPLAISLQFNIDDNVADDDDSYKGRLVFEPYYSETVNTGQWQTWDPMTQGRWWFTGSPMNNKCNKNSPCTWGQVLSYFPNAGIHNTFGAILFKAGSGWTGFDGNVDAFTIGIDNQETTYDFEPFPFRIDIDIKPGSFPNSINMKSQGVIPVAILSQPGFNPVTDVKQSSLTFGATGDEQSFTSRCDSTVGDLNSDDTPDLVCYFETQKTGFTSGSTTGTLKGETQGNHSFQGTDSVRIVPGP